MHYTYRQTQMRASPLCLTGGQWLSWECLWACLCLVMRLISNLGCSPYGHTHTHPLRGMTWSMLCDDKHYCGVRFLSPVLDSLIPMPGSLTTLNVKEKWLISLPSISLSPSLSFTCSRLVCQCGPPGRRGGGEASQRSDLPPLLLCSSPTFRPLCPVGRRVTDWHLSPRIEYAFRLGNGFLSVCVCADEDVPFGAE